MGPYLEDLEWIHEEFHSPGTGAQHNIHTCTSFVESRVRGVRPPARSGGTSAIRYGRNGVVVILLVDGFCSHNYRILCTRSYTPRRVATHATIGVALFGPKVV